MKKFCFSLAIAILAPAIILSVVTSASAQRRNTTSHDVISAQKTDNINKNSADYLTNGHISQYNNLDCNCKTKEDCPKHCKANIHNKHDKKKHHKKTDEYYEDLDDYYNDAIEKINYSHLSSAQKNLLISQAEQNKELMIKQFNEKQELIKKHMQQYDENDFPMKNKENRKIIKKIRKILSD